MHVSVTSLFSFNSERMSCNFIVVVVVIFIALDPNPFANILNPSANAQFPLNPIHFQLNPLTTMPMNSMPPPPPIPPIAFTPPPNVPHNLGQLSDEELRILEGNERRSIEERIKVCTKGHIAFCL